MKKKLNITTNQDLSGSLLLYSLVLFIWTVYRLLFSFPVWIEEFFIKGLIFSLPFIILPLSGELINHIGITRENFFKSVYLGIIMGLVLGLAGQTGNFIRHQSLQFSTYGLSPGNLGAFLILALVTAFWEQLLFTGYFLTRISFIIRYEILSVVITGILFSLIHLPALVITQQQPLMQAVISTLLLFLLGTSCAILKIRQKNLIAPIMAHALWGVTVFLFR